jgi:signal-transduction protein with cAMP-binding, CBS, and nucleotidyltransferase domain
MPLKTSAWCDTAEHTALRRKHPESGVAMEQPFKTPEQLLAYKTIPKLLATKPAGVISIAPASSVFEALQLMDKRDIGFLVVLEENKMVGVLSERDYARKVILAGKASKDTPVYAVMTKAVISVALADAVPHCMAMMTRNRIRHLPVLEGSLVVGVLSMRDLLKEIITHHERLIRDMELERIAILNSGASSY